MQIKRTLHLSATDGDAVHCYGQCYAEPTGTRLVEWAVHHAFNGSYYYTRQSYQRISDDNGKTWRVHGPIEAVDPNARRALEHSAPRHLLDPVTGRLLSFYSTWLIASDEPQFSSNTTAATYRCHFRASEDGGLSWGAWRQMIQRGAGFDEKRWMPGVEYGRNGGYYESSLPLALGDGTILLGIVVSPVDAAGKLYIPYGGYWYDTHFVRGKWNADRTNIEWDFSAPIAVTPLVSTIGACEPDVVDLGNGRLAATLRTQGSAAHGFFSSRQLTVSNDAGKTWSPPTPLLYDDGSPAFVPASYSAFLRSPRTGKIYWFANLLPRGVHAQYPRCPLVAAEFDPATCRLIRRSATVVQDLPPGAPACTSDLPKTDEECGRQYTNFGAYVDRVTGEMVIVVTEMPKASWADFTSDSIEIRILD